MQAVDATTSSNGVLSTIYTDDKNILEFDFKYYNKGGSEMTSIPELYLLAFGVA